MSITNFIPNVWSQTLANELNKEYVAVRNCNRDFEGEIKRTGDVVKINSLGPVGVFNYTKDTDMTNPQVLTGTTTTLVISQAKAFNFQIDDIDRAQSSPKLLTAAMKNAAGALADEADRYVFSLYSSIAANKTITNSSASNSNIIDLILEAREKLLSANVNSHTETVLEVSPSIAAQILKAKIFTNSANDEYIDNGYIGSFVGFKVYVSNNVVVGSDGFSKCLARTTRSIAFAEQLSEIEAYRPEKRFADAVKGLHLYGATIVYPNEIVLLNLKSAGLGV